MRNSTFYFFLLVMLFTGRCFGTARIEVTVVNDSGVGGAYAWHWTRTDGVTSGGSSGIGAGSSSLKTANDDSGFNSTWQFYFSSDSWVHSNWIGTAFEVVNTTNFYTFFCSGNMTNNCTNYFSVCNGSQQEKYYALFQNGSFAATIYVKAGKCQQFGWPDPNCNTVLTIREILAGSFTTSDSVVIGANGGIDSGSHSVDGNAQYGPQSSVNSTHTPPEVGGGGGGGSNTFNPPPPVQYTNNTSDGTNSPILYNSTNTAPATDGTIKQGLDGLYNAVVQGSRDVVSQVKASGDQITTAVNGVSSNVVVMTGKLHEDLTNAVASAHRDATNDFGGSTNIHSAIVLPSVSDAQASGATAVGTAVSTVNGMVSAVPVPSIGDGGSEMDATINAGGAYSFHIRPAASAFSGVFAVIHHLWEYILCFGYAGKVVTELWRIWGKLSKYKGITIQQLEVVVLGTGGNAAGVVLAPLVVVLTLGLWAAWLALVFSLITGAIDWPSLMSNMTGDPTAGMDSGAKWLLIQTFPLGLACSLVSAYIVFRLSMFKIALLAAAAMKFVVGG